MLQKLETALSRLNNSLTNSKKCLPSLLAIAMALLFLNIATDLTPRTYLRKSPTNIGLSVFREKKTTNQNRPTIYGFIPYWKLDAAEYIQLDKVTDIAYFALSINSDGTIKKFDENGHSDPGYSNWRNNKSFTELVRKAKASNVNMATTAIIHDDEAIELFLSCTTCWKTFVSNISEEMSVNEITDLNLDLEYEGEVTEALQRQYSEFVLYTNRKLDEKFVKSKVIVSVFANSPIRPRLTDVKTLAAASDGLFIMAYDFHYRMSDYAGPVAPIKRNSAYTSYDIETMLVDYSRLVESSKLILGVPYYGYNWVVNAKTPYAQRLEGNDYVGYSKSLTFEDVNDLIISLKPKIDWDELASVPYFTYQIDGIIRQVYFEDAKSLRNKYKLAKSYNVGGIGIWALGYDGGYQDLWKVLGEEFL